VKSSPPLVRSLLVPTHTLLIPDETRTRLAEYLVALQSGRVSAGERLKDNLADIERFDRRTSQHQAAADLRGKRGGR
jgi:hypothetical protein